MSRRSLLVVSACWLGVWSLSGCASGPSMAKKETISETYEDSVEADGKIGLDIVEKKKIPETYDDKWAIVGREGRGNRKMEKEDPLDRFLMSDKAREINRNVGFE